MNIDGLNLKNNQNLERLELNGIEHKYSNSYSPLYIRKGKTINGIPGVTLPDFIKVKFIDHNSNLIREKDDLLLAGEEGESEVRYTIINEKNSKYKDVLWTWNKPLDYESFYVSVFDVDIASKLFDIDLKDSYIYVKNTTKEKDIIENIYFPSNLENMFFMHSAIDKNKYKVFMLNFAIEDLKLIKITSNKYVIMNNDIIYYGEFNLDKVRVTNATKEIVDDKLIIKFNDKIVDTFNLVKLNSLIGDTNNDGEITISDMILQYKHVEYELELENDTFYRADMNSDNDVEIIDVEKLYNNLKISN